MKTRNVFLFVAGALCLFLAVPAFTADRAPADDPDPIQDASGSEVRFYGGSALTQPGRFEGRVVCLRTDRNFAVGSATECEDGSRVYALSMNGGDLVQPVLTTTKDAHEALVEHLHRNVVIEGRHYNSIGMILASAVNGEQSGSELY